MRNLAILVIACILLSIGCNGEESDEVSKYDAGIEAYKRGHYAVALANFESRAMKSEDDFVAQFCLGYMYDLRQVPLPEYLKNSTETNIADWYKKNAEKWYTKSAEQDYVPAQNNLAIMYFDRSKAVKIKMEEVGWARDLVLESLENLESAVKWFGNPGTQAHYIPQYNIALIHYNRARLNNKSTLADKSDQAKASYKAAVSSFTKSAKLGYHRAQYELANRYYYDEGVDENLTEVERWKEAVKWYTKAANNDNTYAQSDLAMMYESGEGIDENLTEVERWKEAVKWYEKAANNGYAHAQNNLAYMYQNGKGVDENLTEVKRWKEAVKWYTKAANNGYVDAQNRLAIMYKNGKGVRKNLEKATRLYFQAAQQGQILAQVNVGKFFEEGVGGVPQDNEEAYYWYSLALKDPTELDKSTGENTASKVDKWRKDVGDKIDEKKNEIQERVDNWKPKSLIYSGTGFYIDKNHILTNAHVIFYEDRDGNKHTYDELRVDFRYVRYVIEKQGVEAADHDVDLALLFDESENMYTATFRNVPVYRGEKIALFGYPKIFDLSYKGNATSGDVSGLLGPIKSSLSHDPLDLFQHTAPQQPGNSGGPVFDSDGNVVGISVISLSGDQIENVHFAIKFEAIQKFLNDNGIDANSVSKDIEDMAKVIDLKKISTKAERFTKHVLCFKNTTPRSSMLTRMSIGYWKF